jgi:hypothetical protein
MGICIDIVYWLWPISSLHREWGVLVEANLQLSIYLVSLVVASLQLRMKV